MNPASAASAAAFATSGGSPDLPAYSAVLLNAPMATPLRVGAAILRAAAGGPLLARPVAHLQQVAWMQPDVAEHPVTAMRELIEGSGFPQAFLLAPTPGRQRRVGPAHHVAEHSSAQRARPPDIGSVVSARKHVDLLEVAVSKSKRRQR